jgi:RNA-directed DNA polymerase
VIAKINPILRGWVNYFRVGHSSSCFSMVKRWVEKKVRQHLMRARGRKGYGWKRWSSACQLRLKIPHCTGRKVRHPRAVKVYSFNRLDENGTGW